MSPDDEEEERIPTRQDSDEFDVVSVPKASLAIDTISKHP
jgi:hypothetical protein